MLAQCTRPRFSSDNTLSGPSSLSLADTSLGRLTTSFAASSSFPDTPTMMIPITPTVTIPTQHSNYTYSADSNNDAFSSSDASTAMSSLFDDLSSDADAMSWTQDSFIDAVPNDAVSWSRPPLQFGDALHHYSRSFLDRHSPDEVFSMDSDVTRHDEALSHQSSLEPSTHLMAPTAMHVTPSWQDVASLEEALSTQTTSLVPSWLDQEVATQSLFESNPPALHRRTLSESPAATSANCLQAACSFDNHSSDTTSPPLPLSQSDQLAYRRDIGLHLASMLDPALTSSFAPSSERNKVNSAFHVSRRPSTAFSSVDGTPEPSQGDADMYTVLSHWNFEDSRPAHSTHSLQEPTNGAIPKKRRSSGHVVDATQSKRKLGKSFRRFSSLSKEVGVQEGCSSGTEDIVKNATTSSGKSSSMSYSISQKIALKVRSAFEDEEDQEISYPDNENLRQRALLAQGPDSSSGDEPEVEINVNVIQRTTAGELDIYTPRWSRGTHRERDGWCHLCEKGGWYSMKRSQYLYHLQYDHGISSQTKKVFDPPKAMRVWDDAVQSTEGLCGTCNSWIPICFGPVRKRNFKVYFKHIHACQRNNA